MNDEVWTATPNTLTPAAQYLRMSTDDQKCSMPLQISSIEKYAQRHGYILTKTYIDSGKSGVVLKHRNGLNELLQDVITRKATYRAILVHDVSRWGRFQDPDEGAYYEFLCKQSGIPVLYCAEAFQNDLSLSNSVLKALKRNMAAEYSRDLSVKCFRGQKRLAQLGFRVGAAAGYGLRRLAVSADGKRKAILRRGEYKSLLTDRVVLIPGSQAEVKCIRAIYAKALEHKGATQIARELNNKHIRFRDGNAWAAYAVDEILRNPKYMGCNVWNRTSKKLDGPCVAVPSQEWVVNPLAFCPIVDPVTFNQVQQILPRLAQWTDSELLQKLKDLLAERKTLSVGIIKATPEMPSIATIYRRFGGFRHLYELLNYGGATGAFYKTDQSKRTLLLRDRLIKKLRDLFPGLLTVSYLPQNMRTILSLSSGKRVSIRICRRRLTVKGNVRWTLYCGKPIMGEDSTLVCLLNETNTDFHEYYLLPHIETEMQDFSLKPNDPLFAAGSRLSDLGDLYGFADGMSCQNPVRVETRR